MSKVNCKLRRLAHTCTENTEAVKKLSNQTEDFAVQLIDQVNAKEELVIRDVPEIIDRYASMLCGMTDDAIMHSQKKVCVFSKLASEIHQNFSQLTNLAFNLLFLGRYCGLIRKYIYNCPFRNSNGDW